MRDGGKFVNRNWLSGRFVMASVVSRVDGLGIVRMWVFVRVVLCVSVKFGLVIRGAFVLE